MQPGTAKKILGPRGEVLNPDPPSGFYVSGACPVCQAPIFFHAGGEYYEQPIAGPQLVHQINDQVWITCDCPKGEVELRVPENYDLARERQSIMLLYTMWSKTSETLGDALIQLQEFVNEREQYLGNPLLQLPEKAGGDPSGETNGG